jgi:hypothetical protein
VKWVNKIYQNMKKKFFSKLTQGTTSFWVPLLDLIVAFPFSSLQIKPFCPLLLESAFDFHLRAEQRPHHPSNPAY